MTRRALGWNRAEHRASILLTGEEIDRGEAWLAAAVAKEPTPTALQAEYIQASRAAQRGRRRRQLAGVSVTLVVAIALSVLSFGFFMEIVCRERSGARMKARC